jgi:ADP-ribose pyrophosphatase YjhB (NUDIX family)
MGVSTVVVEDGRVLVVLRRRPPLARVWSFPGGAVELGESLAEAARREVHEETGVAVRVLERLDLVEAMDADTASHWVLAVHVAVPEPDQPSPSPGGDAARAEWVTPQELAQREAVPNAADIARSGIARASRWQGRGLIDVDQPR